MSDTESADKYQFEVTGQNLVNVITHLNNGFDYGEKMEDPAFWADMLQQQLDEIEENAEDGEMEKVHNEFADCIFVAVKALMEVPHPRDKHWTATTYARAINVIQRSEDVQETYNQRWGDR